MLGLAVETVEWHETDLRVAVPHCAGCVAAMLMCGYRLLGNGAVNHEDVLTGCDRLQNFRYARARDLRRLVRFHFRAGGIHGARTLGEARRIGAREFVWRWNQDGALRRTLTADPRYEDWYAAVFFRLGKKRQVLLAEEAGRSCYGLRRGDARTLRDFAGMMENGF